MDEVFFFLEGHEGGFSRSMSRKQNFTDNLCRLHFPPEIRLNHVFFKSMLSVGLIINLWGLSYDVMYFAAVLV